MTEDNSELPITQEDATIQSSGFAVGDTLVISTVPSSDISIPDPSSVASTVLILDLFNSDGENVQPSGIVQICLVSSEPADTLCLAYLNDENVWICEDLALTESEGKLCRSTSHFTMFALTKAPQPESPVTSLVPDPATPDDNQAPVPIPIQSTFSVFTYAASAFSDRGSFQVPSEDHSSSSSFTEGLSQLSSSSEASEVLLSKSLAIFVICLFLFL